MTKVIVIAMVARGKKTLPITIVLDENGVTGEVEYICPSADEEVPTRKPYKQKVP